MQTHDFDVCPPQGAPYTRRALPLPFPDYRFSFLSASIGLSRSILRMAYSIVTKTTRNTLHTATTTGMTGT